MEKRKQALRRLPLPLLLFGMALTLAFDGGQAAQPPTVSVWLRSNGFHTALIVPAAGNNLTDLSLNPEHEWIEYSWGDSSFFVTPGQPPWSMKFKALFAAKGTVMHVVPFTEEKRLRIGLRETMAELRMDTAQFARLMGSVRTGFAFDTSGRVQPLFKGWGLGAMFYKGTGAYSWRYTCNSWTADALRAAGLRMPVWDMTTRPVVKAALRQAGAK